MAFSSHFRGTLIILGVSLVTQTVKNLPAIQETWVWSSGWKDPLEKGVAAHSSILAKRVPWTEEPGRLQSTGSQRLGHNWLTNTFTNYFHTHKLQCLTECGYPSVTFIGISCHSTIPPPPFLLILLMFILLHLLLN